MTQYLPPNLLALFAPRESLPYLAPLDTLPWDKKPWPYSGISQYLPLFEDPSETPAPTRGETKEERLARKRQSREDRHKENLELKINEWDPNSDENIDSDPFKTLFVGRINFDTSESKLRREFEQYGPIKQIHLVADHVTGKPRGYAFIVYEKERDMHAAYKHADGKKIDGKRVVVDVERGRTVKTWKPRRLGGGLGGTRRGAPHENIKYSGRVDERDMDNNERERERDQGDRERDRDRDRDRNRDRERRIEREREREKDRERERNDRDRRGRRSRSRDRERKKMNDNKERNRRDRSRSRERRERDRRDREKPREKEREEKSKGDRNSRREKSHRDRDRDKERGDQDRDRDRDRDRERERKQQDEGEMMKPQDYMEDSMNGAQPQTMEA